MLWEPKVRHTPVPVSHVSRILSVLQLSTSKEASILVEKLAQGRFRWAIWHGEWWEACSARLALCFACDAPKLSQSRLNSSSIGNSCCTQICQLHLESIEQMQSSVRRTDLLSPNQICAVPPRSAQFHSDTLNLTLQFPESVNPFQAPAVLAVSLGLTEFH